ncbi:MAG TPA: LCP family protein, partial [Patescibacteria group bacterium]|nr:LCP family protein [Patescibacteria group bacterium]
MQPRKQFMDNFRNKKGKSSSNSFDGMLGRPNGMPQRNAGGFRPTPGKQPSQPLVRNTLDNFRATDGFHAAQQPLMRNSEAPALGRNPRRTAEGVIDLTLPPAAAKPHKRRSWKKITMRSLAGVMVLVLLVGGFLFGKGYLKLHQIFRGGAEGAAALQDNVDPSRLRGEGDGRVNILMLGIGGQGHDGPDLSDTIIIASIDPVQKQAALLSIPRDLWVKPSGYGYMKINAVYANNKYSALSRKMSEKDAIEYGLNAVDKEIQADIGIPIHYHALIDARGFEQAINTVGGVDINVDAANTVHEVLWDDIANKQYVLDVQQGMQHFDGQRATFYARSRHTSTR